MSTPSTITAIHPPVPHFYHYPDYQLSSVKLGTSNNNLARLAINNYRSTRTSPELHASSSPPFTKQNVSVAMPPQSPSDMSTSERLGRTANWEEFYKNGLPKEVIVIDDDSPEPTRRLGRSPDSYAPHAHINGRDEHTSKRRRVENGTTCDASYNRLHNTARRTPPKANSSSMSENSRGRTASALYSTAPTSLDSSIGSLPAPLEDNSATRKRKRPARTTAEEEREELQVLTQSSWCTYVPPSKPPVKAGEVYVHVIRDV